MEFTSLLFCWYKTIPKDCPFVPKQTIVPCMHAAKEPNILPSSEQFLWEHKFKSSDCVSSVTYPKQITKPHAPQLNAGKTLFMRYLDIGELIQAQKSQVQQCVYGDMNPALNTTEYTHLPSPTSLLTPIPAVPETTGLTFHSLGELHPPFPRAGRANHFACWVFVCQQVPIFISAS